MVPAELYTRISQRLDLDPSSYLGAAELGLACEEAYLALWDIMISALGDEAPWERQTISTTAGVDNVSLTLAQGCYRLLRLEFKGNGHSWAPIRRLSLTADDIDDRSANWSDAQSIRVFARRDFRASESARAGSGSNQTFATWKFYFSPVPSAVYQLRVYYIPPPPTAFTWAANVATYTAFPDDFPEFVVNWVAARMAIKQESDPAPFLAAVAEQQALIERYCKPHTLNMPQFVPDLRSQQNEEQPRDGFWERRG